MRFAAVIADQQHRLKCFRMHFTLKTTSWLVFKIAIFLSNGNVLHVCYILGSDGDCHNISPYAYCQDTSLHCGGFYSSVADLCDNQPPRNCCVPGKYGVPFGSWKMSSFDFGVDRYQTTE